MSIVSVLLASLSLLSAEPTSRAAEPTLTTWEVDGTERTALVALPTTTVDSPPVVFVWHGHGGNSQRMVRTFGVHERWPEAIVLYPQGLKTPGALSDPEGRRSGWQHRAGDQTDRDLKFFDKMLRWLKSEHGTADSHIFSTGHSNGGAFTYLLAGTRPDILTAIAPSAAAGPGARGASPLPVLHIAGRNDRLVTFRMQSRTIAFVRRLNGCFGEPAEWATNSLRYQGRDGNDLVTVIHDGGHGFYQDAPELIVRFFREHVRPKSSGQDDKSAAHPESAPGSSENESDALSRYSGNWLLDSPDGYGSWLSVQLTDDKDPEIRLLWRVGSAIRPQRFTVTNEMLTLFFRRNRLVNGQRVPTERQFVIRRTDDEKPRIEVRRIPDAQPESREETSPAEVTLVATGRPAPPMPPQPDLSKIRFGPETVLFNGRDLSGWTLKPSSAKNGWKVIDGVLVNETPKTDFSAYGEYGNLRSDREFTDHRLHIEFNVDADCNSGVYVRGMYEVQVVDRDSRMQGIQGVGAVFGRIEPSVQAGRAGGEWQTYDITLVDRHITVVLNGTTVIDNQPVEGCTGGALFGDVTRAGPVYLQGDHTSVRYRNIRVRERIN